MTDRVRPRLVIQPIFGAVLLLICGGMSWASTQSLCTSDEMELFSCSVGRKAVSVCSSKELTPEIGYVQYRFGTKHPGAELVYPKERVHPASSFSYGSTGSAKSSLENFHFTLSGHSYTIYRQSAAFDTNGAGIRVKAPDGRSSRLRCGEDTPPSDLYKLNGVGVRKLPAEALVTVESFESWPAESPNADLLYGVRTHNFDLITKALRDGADVNFNGTFDVGVLGALVDGRPEAIRLKNVAEYDEETDRILALLLSRGASPKISSQNGVTALEFLANRAPRHTIQTLLDAGWPSDHHFRLYVGALLGDPLLVKQALDHGADPNKPVRGNRHLVPAITRATSLSDHNAETEQSDALAALELLLKAGARIDEGTPRSGGGDIVLVYASAGHKENIKPVLDMLIRYAPAAARTNSLYWLRLLNAAGTRRENLEWLKKRLEQ